MVSMFLSDIRIATAEQMAHIDRASEAVFGVASTVLMNNAGRAVADAVAQVSPRGMVVVLCGPGNNGGDGYCVARTLRGWGYDAVCFSDAHPEKYSAAANAERQAWLLCGGTVQPLDALADCLAPGALVVDALFGTGLQRPIIGKCAQAITLLNERACRVVAVDIPSGVSCDTGAVLGVAPRCELTVTMGLGKPGLYLRPGRAYAGNVRVAEVGFAAPLVEDERIGGRLLSDTLAADMWRMPLPDAHKGSRGCALVLGGSPEYFGAPLLAAEAVLRAGAGLCVWGCPEGMVSPRPWEHRELLLWPLSAPEGRLGLECWTELEGGINNRRGGVSERILPRIGAICLGPGLGVHPDSAALVAKVVEAVDIPLVVDADALRQLPPINLGERAVLTPHLGEMAALLGISVQEVEADALGAARAAAQKYGATIVLKGVPSIIWQGEKYWISDRSVPVLAQGGTGDVLAGTITSLLAQGYDPASAACLGVVIHAQAGNICAEQIGPQGVLAGEVVARIPRAFARLGDCVAR